MLHEISSGLAVYIPTSPPLLDVLHGSSIKPKKGDGSKSAGKTLDISCALRVPANSVGTAPFLDAVIDETLFLIGT
jgi:hypothetical protein